MEVLQLAEQLGNVAQACKRVGIDRTSFYRWRQRFLNEGKSGLANRSRAHHSHPRKTAVAVEGQILRCCFGHPQWSCVEVSAHLHQQGHAVSPSTVHAILKHHQMSRQTQRWNLAELAWHLAPDLDCFDHDFRVAILKRNPRRRPGDLLDCSPALSWRLDIVQVPANWEQLSTYMLLAVEIKTGFALAQIIDTHTSVNEICCFFEYSIVRSFPLSKRRNQTIEICPLLRPYIDYFQKIPLRCGNSEKLKVHIHDNNNVVSMWSRCILKWMQDSPLKIWHYKHHVSIDTRIDSWIRNYNQHFKIPGYPHFGRSPNAIIQKQTPDPIRLLKGKCQELINLIREMTNIPLPQSNIPPPTPQPIHENFLRSHGPRVPDVQKPYYMNTIDSVFASIYGRSAPGLQSYCCGDCVRLTIADRKSGYGLCPIHEIQKWFKNPACEDFMPRGYPIR